MAKTVNMCVRVDPELKAQAEIILEQLGMNMNGTINMFLTQIVREKRVPLNLSLNNDKEVLPDIYIYQNRKEKTALKE
jgi:DNA-damage-inducible protein J